MRDFQRPGRSTVHGTRGVAATSHPLATLTAIELLRAGGNAVDAAVAACAVQGVVEPQSTGIGGDCFALYAPGGRVPPYAINGSGPAPAQASVDWFRERGIDAIGFESPHAVTVPGAVGTWERLLAEHGTKGLDEVLQPAIRYAEEGFVVHSRVAYDWGQNAEKLRACENASAFYLPGGRAPRAGDIHRLPQLAATLRLIAKDGAAAFYRGAIADDIASHLAAHGSLMTADDLAAFQPQEVAPISANYRGFDIYECPPNGQGIIALIILNILEGLELAGLDPVGPERLHLEAEACRLGYRDRAALIADPDAVDVPVAGLLSAEYADAMRRHISAERAMPPELPPGYPAHGDTIYLTVVDGAGNAISFINSLFASFGSGLCTASGVMLQNRGASFVIDPDHPNRIAGGKRPMHTIIPGMVGAGGARGDALRRHGRALPGLRPRALPHQRYRLRHGPAGGAGLPPRLPLRRRHGAGDHHRARGGRTPRRPRPRGRVVGHSPRRRPGHRHRPRHRRSHRRLRPPQGRLRVGDLS